MADRKDRLTYYEKNKDNKKWYKDRIDEISQNKLDEDYKIALKVNYDLFNNKINPDEFDYVCKPLGDNVGKLPTELQNRDIVSGKVKTILGMEMQRPFNYRVFSTNPEATTEKEKKEFNLIKEYVVSQIMKPIEEQLQLQKEQQIQQLIQTPQEGINVQQQIQQLEEQFEEAKSQMTPEEVKRYMEREYQDPSEVLASQLLSYFRYKLNLKEKFSDCFKNGLISAKSIMYVGILGGEPTVKVVNPLRFNCSSNEDTEFIEDSEWAVCEYLMTPSEITKYFSKELKDSELDRIYSTVYNSDNGINPSLFYENTSDNNISVYHCVWKSLRKIGFIHYIDEYGEEQTELVDEHFKPKDYLGDITVEWEWITEVYEGWKIDIEDPIYVNLRPLPGQHKDLDNIRESKLPYYGVIYDSYNSTETSLMDRIKYYQYLYNVVMYRLELLMSSDKGKKLMMNINNVPDSLGIDMNTWQYYAETSPYIWFNPSEEGNQGIDANNVAKVMDLSLVSDIKKYIEIAEYVRQQCGKSVGITEQVEGQIGQYEAVRNTNQALIQSSYILEPYFLLHEQFKVNILTALIEVGKVCYSSEKPNKINYIMDDMSKHTINIEPGILDNSTFGIFISSSSNTEKTKELIQQLAQAALQNQTVEFSDIISVMNAESVPEAKEVLQSAEKRRIELQQKQQAQQQQHEQQMQEQLIQAKQEEFERQKELIVLKEEERRKTEIAKMSIMGASYNPNHDGDNDGINDFIELSKLELEKYSKEEDLKMKRDELELKHQAEISDINRKDMVAKAQANSYRQKLSNRPR